jgi:hypothetical protein
VVRRENKSMFVCLNQSGCTISMDRAPARHIFSLNQSINLIMARHTHMCTNSHVVDRDDMACLLFMRADTFKFCGSAVL